jgi:hypothetical protein
MTAKTTGLYGRVIDRIKAVAAEINRVPLEPELMVSDYEIAILTAVAAKFPNGRALGCYFHKSQVHFKTLIVQYYLYICNIVIFIYIYVIIYNIIFLYYFLYYFILLIIIFYTYFINILCIYHYIMYIHIICIDVFIIYFYLI